MREALRDILETARTLARKRLALVLFFAAYVGFLASVGLFITTSEATVKQLLLTFAMMLVAPALFFFLQAMCVHWAQGASTPEMLRRSVRDFWKLLLASLPLILIAVALYLLLGKIEARFAFQNPARLSGAHGSEAAGAEWLRLLFSTIRLLLFGLAVPLLSIHLWIALMHEEASLVLRSIKSILSKAFAPRSVATYVFGLALFGLVPYLLLAFRTPVQSAWAEVAVLSARIGLALSFTLFGWVITVGALQRGMRAR